MAAPAKILFKLVFLLLICQLLHSCSGTNSTEGFTGFGISPNITSEDDDIHSGGHEPPNQPLFLNLCDDTSIPQRLILRLSSVENGTVTEPENNSPTNPVMLNIGRVFGFDADEALTHLHVEAITISPTDVVGDDPDEFGSFLNLMMLEPLLANEILADFVLNEPVLNSHGQIIGNRIATWSDPEAYFDGALDLGVTYALQICRAYLINPLTKERRLVRSQPIYIQAQLTAP